MAVPTPTPLPGPLPEGALIAVSMDSRVGLLLDELPDEMRDRVADELSDLPDELWVEMALRQVRLTKRRLNFRNFIYNDRGQLPLPPPELWTIDLDPDGPTRRQVDEHDLVTIDYTFRSTLLTDVDSPAAAEPALSDEGGEWNEPFVLPLDPNLLLQRTGNTCLNEAGFPPNSIDSENAWIFFDYTCQANSGGALGCHRTQLPGLSCRQALSSVTGSVETEVKFERLAWDPDLAQEVRAGEVTQLEGPDLSVVDRDLEDYRIIYRYFPPDSCALAENCVGGSGWRRLLQFTATVHNVGAETLQVGSITGSDPLNELFEYNSCHAHFHFSNYGEFFVQGEDESLFAKQAFCVESTNRFSNNEWSPLTHPYTCRNQGVQAGWVDEYVAGLDCQWVDITDIVDEKADTVVTLGFNSNPDRFLCEGALLLDQEGNLVWEPSGLVDDHGDDVERPGCEFIDDWDFNNQGALEISVPPSGSFVTEPCASGLLGPLRNCGFAPGLATVEVADVVDQGEAEDLEDLERAYSCRPGRPVTLSCNVDRQASAQVLRICEYSQMLGTGVACPNGDALDNEVVTSESVELSFTCPFPRDENEPGGRYSLYSAPLFTGDASTPISCTVES